MLDTIGKPATVANMSAWIVSKKHIDVIVAAAVSQFGAAVTDPSAVGRILWTENHKSVNARYRENIPVPEYAYEPPTEQLSAIVTIKQIKCYDYQSCEHKGWKGSSSLALCRALLMLLADELGIAPGDVDDYPGYEEAPWGIDE